jgi:hypothetical protein
MRLDLGRKLLFSSHDSGARAQDNVLLPTRNDVPLERLTHQAAGNARRTGKSKADV